jgi:hypothetical protein
MSEWAWRVSRGTPPPPENHMRIGRTDWTPFRNLTHDELSEMLRVKRNEEKS